MGKEKLVRLSLVGWKRQVGKRLLCFAKLHYMYARRSFQPPKAAESARPGSAPAFGGERGRGGLSFCGKAAKTCAAPRRQARFLIGGQEERLAYKSSRPVVRAPEKVVATVSRREGVYNRAGEPSVPFWDRGAAALLDNEVAFTRPHVNYACCDAGIPYI